jgi:hypothetical protein
MARAAASLERTRAEGEGPDAANFHLDVAGTPRWDWTAYIAVDSRFGIQTGSNRPFAAFPLRTPPSSASGSASVSG